MPQKDRLPEMDSDDAVDVLEEMTDNDNTRSSA